MSSVRRTRSLGRYIVSELGEGSPQDMELVERRLRIIGTNVGTLAALVVSGRLLGAPALELVGVAMLCLGTVSARYLHSMRAEQVKNARTAVWALIGAAVPIRLLIAWATNHSDLGLPNLLGTQTGPIAEQIGTTALPALFVFAVLFIPVLYVRYVIQSWRLLETRADIHRKIIRTSRGRAARRL